MAPKGGLARARRANVLEKNEKYMEAFEEVQDQAGLMFDLTQAHLNTHGGKIDPTCFFCKNFIVIEPKPFPLESYKFIIFDATEDNPNAPIISENHGK
jgi:hypothetical protein